MDISQILLAVAGGVLLLPYAYEYLFGHKGLINRMLYDKMELERGFLPTDCPIRGAPDYEALLASHEQEECHWCFTEDQLAVVRVKNDPFTHPETCSCHLCLMTRGL